MVLSVSRYLWLHIWIIDLVHVLYFKQLFNFSCKFHIFKSLPAKWKQDFFQTFFSRILMHLFPLLKLTLQWYLESAFCGHKCHPWISKNSIRGVIMTNSEIIWLPRTRYTRGWPLLTPPMTPPPLWIRIWNGCRSKCNGPTIRGLKGHVRTKTLGGEADPRI